MTDRFAIPGSSILRDQCFLTDKHEEAGTDPTLIATKSLEYFAEYMKQKGVPFRLVLIPMKGKIG